MGDIRFESIYLIHLIQHMIYNNLPWRVCVFQAYKNWAILTSPNLEADSMLQKYEMESLGNKKEDNEGLEKV